MDGSGDEELPVAIDDEGTAVVGDIGGETQRKEEEEEEAKCKEGEREPHCIAHLLLHSPLRMNYLHSVFMAKQKTHTCAAVTVGVTLCTPPAFSSPNNIHKYYYHINIDIQISNSCYFFLNLFDSCFLKFPTNNHIN